MKAEPELGDIIRTSNGHFGEVVRKFHNNILGQLHVGLHVQFNYFIGQHWVGLDEIVEIYRPDESIQNI